MIQDYFDGFKAPNQETLSITFYTICPKVSVSFFLPAVSVMRYSNVLNSLLKTDTANLFQYSFLNGHFQLKWPLEKTQNHLFFPQQIHQVFSTCLKPT